MHRSKRAGVVLLLAIGAAECFAPIRASAENLNQKFGPSWTCTKLGAVEYSLYRACRICEENCQDFFSEGDKTGHCLPKAGAAVACPQAAAAPPPPPPQATPVATSPGQPASPSVAQDPAYFEFKVCNRSGRTASVAVEHHVSPTDKNFVIRGWWTVPAGECQAIGNFPQGWFYYYAAEYGTDAFEWAGNDAKVCIERIGQIERMHTRTTICTGKYLRGFHAAQVDYPNVTWNLDP
jgi:uncharacterized membrane protein